MSLIVITGCSSGIGAATARAFSAQGHSLLLLARRVAPMEALQLPRCLVRGCDVAEAVAAAEAEFGLPVACAVANAGLMQLGNLITQDEREWDAMFSVNCKGVRNLLQAVLPGMRERRRGTVIAISSIAGHKSFPNHAAYCGTKFAVGAIMETVRKESAPFGVRACVISPGVVSTELLGHSTDPDIIAGSVLGTVF